MFKEYEKKYENYLTRRRILNKCKIEYVGNTMGISTSEYKKIMKKHCKKYQKFVWDWLIKMTWLSNKFTYKGYQKHHSFLKNNGFVLDSAYVVFMLNFVGYNFRLFKGGVIFKIISYFDDFYPEFNESDPFKVKYEYPYKNVVFDDLLLVYQMDERLDLLNIKEKSRMNHPAFVDYIINYVYCLNEELGRLKYRFIDTRRERGKKFAPNRQAIYVRNIDKLSYEQRSKLKKAEASDIY